MDVDTRPLIDINDTKCQRVCNRFGNAPEKGGSIITLIGSHQMRAGAVKCASELEVEVEEGHIPFLFIIGFMLTFYHTSPFWAPQHCSKSCKNFIKTLSNLLKSLHITASVAENNTKRSQQCCLAVFPFVFRYKTR